VLPTARAESEYPLWDKQEAVEQYAERVGLPATKKLDLGHSVSMEFVLIPAGQFTIGTPEPKPVDEDRFVTQIWIGKAVFWSSVCVLLAILALVFLRAIQRKHHPQVSLARLLALALIGGCGLLGGLHWHFSTQAFENTKRKHERAWTRYAFSGKAERPTADWVLSKPFYMSRYEVTQAQYEEVTASNPSEFRAPDLPVERTNWFDAQLFCEKLTEAVGRTVRLPSEAEWEYACRAGTRTTYYAGDEEVDLSSVAWYWDNSKKRPSPVGKKEANAFGLHDMHGNVSEWTSAWLDYGTGSDTHPPLRGGSWIDSPWFCRSACRCGSEKLQGTARYYRSNHVGFRVVMDVPTE